MHHFKQKYTLFYILHNAALEYLYIFLRCYARRKTERNLQIMSIAIYKQTFYNSNTLMQEGRTMTKEKEDMIL